MYPGTDRSHFEDTFETLDELKKTIKDLDKNLNQVISWGFYEAEVGFPAYLEVLIFMPRKTQTTLFKLETEATDELKLWIEHELRKRALSYFDVSWKGGGE